MISYYYNPKTKAVKSKILLKSELHASIPVNYDPEKIGEYFLIHLQDDVSKPEFNSDTQYVVYGDVKKSGSEYIREWVVKNYTEEELEQNAEAAAEQEKANNEAKLKEIHDKCDEYLAKTDYLFNIDYDGTGHDNEAYMNAMRTTRSTWRRLRQTDELTGEEVPAIPSINDYV